MNQESSNWEVEEAQKMQILIGEICYKIEGMKTEIKMWRQIETQTSWIEYYKQSKRTQLVELFMQKILLTKALGHYLLTKEMLEPYELIRKNEYLSTLEFRARVEGQVELWIENPDEF